jgi:tRNA CCA-adding enzyme
VLKRVDPPKEDLEFIESNLKIFLDKFKKKLKESKIKAEVFVGGSFAKGTVIKKDIYDIDVFIRFNPEYKDEEMSNLLKKILKSIRAKNVSLVHGSRDYFRIRVRKDFFIELIPVTKISKPKQARNITDLSYSHVNYIKKKITSEKMQDDIRIAKAFCHANGTYGAESYIRGFSGYALELLVYHYKGFLNFIKAMTTIKEKTVIDIERHYINKNRVLMDMNASKLVSPIVLVDPTYRQRNALAALSDETLKKFQKACRDFLKNPTLGAFEPKEINLEKIKADAEKKKLEFIKLVAKTEKQIGDVAGSKLLKFFRYLERQISRYFDIKKSGFGYDGGKTAVYYFVAKSKKYIEFAGPFTKDKKSVAAFKKHHKHTFTKAGKIYAKEKVDFNLKSFIKSWKAKNRKLIREMSVVRLLLQFS